MTCLQQTYSLEMHAEVARTSSRANLSPGEVGSTIVRSGHATPSAVTMLGWACVEQCVCVNVCVCARV